MNKITTISDHPILLSQWHPTKNEGLFPNKITLGSNIPISWQCLLDASHEWKTSPHQRRRLSVPSLVTTCPFCSGQIATIENCLFAKFPDMSKEWHPTKNGDLNPYNILPFSSKKVWWFREECGHEWETKLASRTVYNGGCPYCSNKRVCIENCLDTTHPEIAKEWHPTKNDSLTPYDITYGSKKVVWWLRVECKHEWDAPIEKRTGNQKSNCPYCSNRRVCLDNSLLHTHPKLASEWHTIKNSTPPSEITHGSNLKCWWLCGICGFEWQATVANRSGNKSGCPECQNKSKGEEYIASILEKLCINHERQYTFNECRHKNPLPFDFAIINHNDICLIEYQGEQHYRPVKMGGISLNRAKEAFHATKRNDRIKKDYCEKNNYPLLIIPHWKQEESELLIKEFIDISKFVNHIMVDNIRCKKSYLNKISKNELYDYLLYHKNKEAALYFNVSIATIDRHIKKYGLTDMKQNILQSKIPSKEDLYNYLLKHNHKEAAEHFGINISVIERRIKKYGLTNTINKIPLKEEFETFYTGSYSLKEIAEHYRVDVKTITNWRKRFDIPPKSKKLLKDN